MRAARQREFEEDSRKRVLEAKTLDARLDAEEVARDAAEREKKRFERSQVERKDMIRHLTMDMKLRDEDEIANERREGSSMSKGGKDDFVDTAKKKGDMSSF